MGKEEEAPLLAKSEEESNSGVGVESPESSPFRQELKRVSSMAAPMVAVTVSQYLLQVVSMMMVGHIGKLSFSGVAIATSFAEVTGFSVLVISSFSFVFNPLVRISKSLILSFSVWFFNFGGKSFLFLIHFTIIKISL